MAVLNLKDELSYDKIKGICELLVIRANEEILRIKKIMQRILWTFGIGTDYKGKVVITKSENFNDAMYYVYNKYGQENIAFNYSDKYNDIDEMIKKYNYDIIEDVKL